MIDADRLALLRARDPHSIAYLTLEPDPAVAAARLREWLATGLLVRDESPAVWWLEQDSVGADGMPGVRQGIVASLRAVPYSTGAVLPHERTHRDSIEGRIALLRATRTQLEPIFVLYDRPPPFDGPPERPADLDVAGSRLWRLEGDQHVGRFFEDVPLLIADGHHRYETAVEFAAEDGADRLMAVLVSTADPGLVICPTHRVFSGRPEIALEGEPCANVEAALAALEREPGDHSAAVLVRRDGVLLLRGERGELDVELVDRLGHAGIAYTSDRDEAVRRVEAGIADVALLVRPLRVSDLFEHALAGRTLPQKATYFFPKLLSGLLLHPVDP